MNIRRQQKALDVGGSAWLLNGCWYSASLGVGILQIRLFAQIWHVSGQAFLLAIVASAWAFGSLLGVLWQSEAAAWRWSMLSILLLWYLAPFIHWTFPYSQMPVIFCIPYAGWSFLLGLTSSAWLVQRRLWPAISEHIILLRGLINGTVGLLVVFLICPLWSALVGTFCLLPLLLLDFRPVALAPLLNPDGAASQWMERMLDATGGRGLRIRLDRGALPRWWWFSYLLRRGRLSFTLLVSVVNILVGCVWGTIPTPFAGWLELTHHLEKLWCVLGVFGCVVQLGFLWLWFPARGVIGRRDRILPENWMKYARLTTSLLLFVMAGSLLALGLPMLQEACYLGASLGIYTLASLLWGWLLPRLRPSITTETIAIRHLFFTSLISRTLPLRQAEEDLVNRTIMILEISMIILFLPFFGWYIDHWTVDGLLMLAGLVFLGFLLLFVLLQARRNWLAPLQAEQWFGTNRVILSGDPGLKSSGTDS